MTDLSKYKFKEADENLGFIVYAKGGLTLQGDSNEYKPKYKRILEEISNNVKVYSDILGRWDGVYLDYIELKTVKSKKYIIFISCLIEKPDQLDSSEVLVVDIAAHRLLSADNEQDKKILKSIKIN